MQHQEKSSILNLFSEIEPSYEYQNRCKMVSILKPLFVFSFFAQFSCWVRSNRFLPTLKALQKKSLASFIFLLFISLATINCSMLNP